MMHPPATVLGAAATAIGRFLAVTVLAASVSSCVGDGGTDDGSDVARQRPDATEIVLLGTLHFAGSLTDESSSEVGDILSGRRQRELDEVAERLSRWGPDAFFVECDPPEQSRLDSLYSAYRSGDYVPTAAGHRGEIRQLGFRVGRRAELERLRCVDAAGVWLGGEAERVGEKHNPAVVAGLDSLDRDRLEESSYLADHTIRELLVEMNSERRLWQNHKAYSYYYARIGTFDGFGMETHREGDLRGATFAFGDDVPADIRAESRETLEALGGSIVESGGVAADYLVLADREAAEDASGPGTADDTLSVRGLADVIQRNSEVFVGFPDHHVGADLVGEWYKRNLRIYANVWRAAEEQDERVVLMIGQGHVWSLRTFFRENPEFEVVPVDEVL